MHLTMSIDCISGDSRYSYRPDILPLVPGCSTHQADSPGIYDTDVVVDVPAVSQSTALRRYAHGHIVLYLRCRGNAGTSNNMQGYFARVVEGGSPSFIKQMLYFYFFILLVVWKNTIERCD